VFSIERATNLGMESEMMGSVTTDFVDPWTERKW